MITWYDVTIYISFCRIIFFSGGLQEIYLCIMILKLIILNISKSQHNIVFILLQVPDLTFYIQVFFNLIDRNNYQNYSYYRQNSREQTDRNTYQNVKHTYKNDQNSYQNDRNTYQNDRNTYHHNDINSYQNDISTNQNDRNIHQNDRKNISK